VLTPNQESPSPPKRAAGSNFPDSHIIRQIRNVPATTAARVAQSVERVALIHKYGTSR
jgi:hypothetical protein